MFGFIRVITPESKGWEETLWWALRGAGGNNFGIVTELTFAMEDAPPKTVCFSAALIQHQTNAPKHSLGGCNWARCQQMIRMVYRLLCQANFNQLDGLRMPVNFFAWYLGPQKDFNKTLSTYTSPLAGNGVYHNTSTSKIVEYDYLGGLNAIMMPFGGIDATEAQYYPSAYAQYLVDNGTYGMTLDGAKAVMYSLATVQPPDDSYNIMPTDFLDWTCIGHFLASAIW